ncbi:MAG: hypothetical protein HY707_03525 [Ignavibacteriae bacterium]|nr:hypothetical protein [Ignavibacteriota bacterium]
MKQMISVALLSTIATLFLSFTSLGQVAGKNELNARIVSDGMILVGDQSDDSQVGPYFGGSIGYGLGYGVTLYVESGFGWTNYDSKDGLRLAQIPVLGGVTYNFGDLLGSTIVQPYVGASAGIANYFLQQDWNTISIGASEQKTTNFAVEGLVGVNFRIPDSPVTIDIRAKYDHVFSDRDRGVGLESHEWNNVGVGGGISYNFSL